MGVDKMKSLARWMCWWSEINSDIRQVARDCADCSHKILQKPRNWTPWPESCLPWQRIHADFCGPLLTNYYALVVIDSYSRWPEIFWTKSMTAEFLMKTFRKCFSREGIPQVLITDNGTPFCVVQVKQWLDSIRCRHLRTAPRHPCLNGIAENFVRTLKSAIKSAHPQNADELESFTDNFLRQYHNACHSTTKPSPAVLVKSRALRASLQCLD